MEILRKILDIILQWLKNKETETNSSSAAAETKEKINEKLKKNQERRKDEKIEVPNNDTDDFFNDRMR